MRLGWAGLSGTLCYHLRKLVIEEYADDSVEPAATVERVADIRAGIEATPQRTAVQPRIVCARRECHRSRGSRACLSSWLPRTWTDTGVGCDDVTSKLFPRTDGGCPTRCLSALETGRRTKTCCLTVSPSRLVRDDGSVTRDALIAAIDRALARGRPSQLQRCSMRRIVSLRSAEADPSDLCHTSSPTHSLGCCVPGARPFMDTRPGLAARTRFHHQVPFPSVIGAALRHA